MNVIGKTPSQGSASVPARAPMNRETDPLRALLLRQRRAQGVPDDFGIAVGELLVPEPRFQEAAAVASGLTGSAAATTIPVGSQPWPVAVAPNGLAYVGNAGSSTVSVIDTHMQSVLGEVAVGGYLGGIAIAPNNRAFVAAYNEVVVLNGIEIVGHIAVPYCENLAIAPDGRAYVTGNGGVTVINIGTGDTLATIDLGGYPNGVAVAPNGLVYVANEGLMAVQVINPNEYQVVETIEVGAAPNLIAVAPNGRAYVTELYGTSASFLGAVVVIDTNDGDQVIATFDLPGPYGVTAAPNGRVIVATPFTGSVAVIDSATDSLLGSVPTGGSAPVGAAVGPDGRVYVTNLYSDNVSVFSQPRLAGLSPTLGTAFGGTEVALNGSDLSDVYEVTFGGEPATGLFTDAAGTQVIATAPRHATGPVTVTATGLLGSASLTDAFEYVSTAPTLESVTPNQGPESGGTQVLLTGSNLTGTTVLFGSSPASNLFYGADGRQLIATTPPHLPGAVDVVVRIFGNGVWAAEAKLPNGFTYLALPPALTSLSPASGPVAGGTRVTITGTHLTGATSVTFNGTEGTDLVVGSGGTELAVTAPAGSAGAATVVVRTPGGTSNPLTFTYVPLPAPTGISPNSGSSAGGTVVTITGTNLGGATSVTFGGVAGTSLSVNTQGTQLTVTTPPGNPGSTAVAVTTPGGTATVPGGFTYSVPTSLTAAPAVINLAGLFSYVIPSISATLTDSVTHAPLAGRTISFSATTAAGRISLGTAVTGSNGVASRTNVSVPATAVTATSYTATFAGTPGYLPAIATAPLTFTPL